MVPPFDRRLLIGLALACGVVYLATVAVSAQIFGEGIRSIPMFLREPNGEVLQLMGAGGRAPMLRGDVWTLISSGYLHADANHLGVNMLGLLLFLPQVQAALGWKRSFLVFTVACITGSLASAAWGEVYSLGASTGFFGLIGAVLVIGRIIGGAWGTRYLATGAIIAITNLAMGFANPDQVSNAGHVGGLLGGVGFSWLLRRSGSPQGNLWVNRGFFVLALAATTLCLALSLGNGAYPAWQAETAPNDFVHFILDRRAADNLVVDQR